VVVWVRNVPCMFQDLNTWFPVGGAT
jgi:hypothetical protein